MTKYADMSAGDMLKAVGDDGQKWAEAFCEQFPEFPEDVALGWFCNAIENAWDLRCSRFTRDDEAWTEFQARVERNRAFWRELTTT